MRKSEGSHLKNALDWNRSKGVPEENENPSKPKENNRLYDVEILLLPQTTSVTRPRDVLRG